MKYEIVQLSEKIVAGFSGVTSNTDPKMQEIIGGLWAKLYAGNAPYDVKNRVNAYAIGLYSDYKEDQYTVTAGFEVSKPENEELTVKVIPAGTYAKFSITGTMEDVGKAWNEIWNTDLDRSYTGDFEEYLNSDMEHAKIDIYIALK